MGRTRGLDPAGPRVPFHEWPPHVWAVRGGGTAWRWYEPMYLIDLWLVKAPHAEFGDIVRGAGLTLRQELVTPASGVTIEHLANDNKNVYVVWVDKDWTASKADDLNTLVHEMMHVAMTALMRRGLQADIGHEEPYCYFAGYLFERYYRCLKGLIPDDPARSARRRVAKRAARVRAGRAQRAGDGASPLPADPRRKRRRRRRRALR